MKYALLIPDGAADTPLEALGGSTPLEAARTPHLDALSAAGRQGTVATTPAGFGAGSDVCCMTLLGYDPNRYHPGRAPLEAAAMGLRIMRGEWVFRCNLVTVVEGVMEDHSAGHIGGAEAGRLIADLVADLQRAGLDAGLRFHPGVGYRNILVDSSERDYAELHTVPPHDILGEAAGNHRPHGGRHAPFIRQLMHRSEEVFADHPVNAARRQSRARPATQVWLWGQGTPRPIPSFEQRYGLRGAMITAVDLLAGLATLIGWDRLEVEGITGYHDTDYAAKGRAACEALDAYDLVCVHVEAPDEASHQADPSTKVASIEAIDTHILGPLVEKLRSFKQGWRILCLPDHYTRVETRRHDPTPVPFCMAGTGVQAGRGHPFSERAAGQSGLHIAYGHELMEYFLRSGATGL